MQITIKIIITLITIITLSSIADAALPVIDLAAVAQLANQLTQLKTETKYLEQELRALKPDQYKWSDIKTSMNNIDEILKHVDGLGVAATDINEQFKTYFPGYQYRKEVLSSYKKMVNKTQNTLNGVLQSANILMKEYNHEKDRLQFYREKIQAADGQMKVLQTSAQITLEIVSQLELMRQAVVTQINAQTVFNAQQLQNMVDAKENLEKVIDAGSTTVPRYGSSGSTLTMPDFKT